MFSTYYFASSNLTSQPECSAVCASFQPADATSEEPQPVSSAQIFGQSWTNEWVVGQLRLPNANCFGLPSNVLPNYALRGSKAGANELYIASNIAWGMHTEQ